MDTSSTTDTHIGIQLRYTLSDGGRRKYLLDAAVAQKDAMTAELENMRKTVSTALAGSLASLRAIDRSVNLMKQKLLAAETQSETSKSQIASGQVSLRGVMDSEITAYRASTQNTKLSAERLILQATIAAGTGSLLKQLNVK
jgi:outer membrane protein TolC